MTKTVKSAVRALEVLELFDRIKREASVGEIARALGCPLSSASVLLNTLAEIGYLAHGEGSRGYHPTARVTLLGTWIAPFLAPTGEIQKLMEHLGARTGETIILAAPIRDRVQYVHVVPATSMMQMHVGPGTTRPLVSSGLGRLLLSTMPDEKVEKLVMRHNEGPFADGIRVSLSALRRDLAATRVQGVAVTLRGITPGAGVIGMLLPAQAGAVPMALGIGGWARSLRTRREEMIGLLRDAVDGYQRSVHV